LWVIEGLVGLLRLVLTAWMSRWNVDVCPGLGHILGGGFRSWRHTRGVLHPIVVVEGHNDDAVEAVVKESGEETWG
jgi:hypothetical protein